VAGSDVLLSPPDEFEWQRALRTPTPATVMKEGGFFGSLYGGTLIKSDSACGERQVGPAPRELVVATSIVSCAGDYQPTLGQQLLAPATHRQQAAPGVMQ